MLQKIIFITLLISISIWLYPNICLGAVEDFETYTEKDDGDDITVTSTKVDVSGADCRNVDYWVVKDYGVGHFGDYEHLITINLTSVTGSNSIWVPWSISDSLGDFKDCLDASNDGQCIRIYHDPNDILFYDYANASTDTYSGTAGTDYFLTIARSGTVGTCKIYSDPDRAEEHRLDTLEITVSETTYRFVYAGQGYNDGSPATFTGYSENLDLQEAPAAVGQFIMITKMKDWNPDLAQKILRTTGRWNIQAQTWYKNWYWDNIRGTYEEAVFNLVV